MKQRIVRVKKEDCRELRGDLQATEKRRTEEKD